MYTVANQVMPRVLLLLSFAVAIHVNGQTGSAAKNFAGVHAGIGWSTSSLSNGASYERIIFSKENKELGARISHTDRYKYGNLSLFYSEFSGISRSDLKLTVSGYIYTNKHKLNTGFFVSGEVGTVTAFWKTNTSSATQLLPVVELGMGWKWSLGNRICLRWTNSIVNSGPLLLHPYPVGVATASTIAVGF
jgi:hypothetical protein